MGDPVLQSVKESHVQRITLQRPDQRNVLNGPLVAQLLAALDQAAADADVRAILLEARGPAFCAGVDVEEILAAGSAGQQPLAQGYQRLFTYAQWLGKPLVAAVQGPALGAGVTLLANADVVVAAQGSSFALTQIRVAQWPVVEFAALAHAMGTRRAQALALTGRQFSVAEALQFGLVHEIAIPLEVDDRATDTAHKLSRQSPAAMARRHDSQHSLTAQWQHPDFAEAIHALRENRLPQWQS